MRRPVLILLIVVAVLLLGVLAIPFLIDANQFRPAIESELTKSLGRQVKIGDLKLRILSGTATASDLSVADDPSFSHTDFLRAKAVTLSIDLWPALFSHKLNVSGMNIDAPVIALIQAPSGLWNFSSLGTASSAQPQAASSAGGEMTLTMKSLKINDARLSLAQAGNKPEILDNVNIEVKDFAPGSVCPFSLSGQIGGGGDIALNGKAGPIDSANAANTPLTATLKLTNLNLVGSGAVPASSGIDGVVSVDGATSSNEHGFEVTGKLKAEKLKLARGGTATRNPLLFDVALTGDPKQHSGQMSRGDVVIGGVKASITGKWTAQGDSSVFNMVLSAPDVPVSGIVDLLPALDIVLPSGTALEGGTAAAKLALAGPASAVVVSGPVSVRNTRLKGFDVGAKMAPIEKFAGLKSGPNTEIQLISANLRAAPDGTTLQDIHIVLPSVGELTGAGTISPANALDFKMRALVRSGTLVSTLGSSSIPFSIGGTSSDPQFRADVGQIASQEINQRLKGVKVGGVDAGQAADSVLQGLFGGKKKK
jgi:AsmA protein